MSTFISRLFGPQLPHWACEFTEQGIAAAGISRGRKRVVGGKSVDVPAGFVTGSLTGKNLADPAGATEMVKSLLREAGFRGSEIAVVIPDNSSRIAFMTAETLPAAAEERDSFVRWKLKKTMPFDVEKAQVAVKVLGKRGGDEGYDLLVALCPRDIVEEYVGVMDGLSIHAGLVIPSTLAAVNLIKDASGDTLFVKAAPGCISTTILQDQRIQFSRRVSEMPLYEAVYPTFQYYQDKIGGRGLQRLVMCAANADVRALTDLGGKLGMEASVLDPQGIEDVFKPALGAVGLV